MSALPAEQRLNMSLEEVIKANQHKRNNAPATPTRINKSRQAKRNNSSPSTPNQSTSQVLKVAKTLGAAKAKRNASIDQRRGLRTSGTATKAEVNQHVRAQTAKAVKSSGLKISFRPQDLPKTTERVVTQQIRAVLSRQSAPKKAGPGTSKPILSPRTVAPTTPRRNPKVRGKTVLKVQH
eukprot:gene5786-6371_t